MPLSVDEYMTSQRCVCGGLRATCWKSTEQCCNQCGLARLRDLNSATWMHDIAVSLLTSGIRPDAVQQPDDNIVKKQRATQEDLFDDGSSEDDSSSYYSTMSDDDDDDELVSEAEDDYGECGYSRVEALSSADVCVRQPTTTQRTLRSTTEAAG